MVKNKNLNLLLKVHGKRKNADYIRYQEQIEDAVVNVTIKIEERGVKLNTQRRY